ncbi:hypothetical protein V6Z12_D05G296700 [Gossypium hirsutum]
MWFDELMRDNERHCTVWCTCYHVFVSRFVSVVLVLVSK